MRALSIALDTSLLGRDVAGDELDPILVEYFRKVAEVTAHHADTEFWLLLEQAGHDRTANKPGASKDELCRGGCRGGEAGVGPGFVTG